MKEPLLMAISYAVVIAIIAGLSWLAIKGSRTLRDRGKSKLDILLASFNPQGQERPGWVKVNFPVYVGTVFYVVEFHPQFYVERHHVRKAINSLAAFSLKYGLLTGLAPYVLFMVFVNYLFHVPKVLRS